MNIKEKERLNILDPVPAYFITRVKTGKKLMKHEEFHHKQIEDMLFTDSFQAPSDFISDI